MSVSGTPSPLMLNVESRDHATSSNDAARAFQSKKFAGRTGMGPPPVSASFVSQILTRRSGRGYGAPCSRTVLTRLKIAVLAPIPSTSVATMTIDSAGLRRVTRRAYRRSCCQPSIRASGINGRCRARSISALKSASATMRIQNASTAIRPAAMAARRLSRKNSSSCRPKRSRNAAGYSRSRTS